MSAKSRNVLIAAAAVAVMAGSLFVPDVKIESAGGDLLPGEHWNVFVQFFPGLMHNIHHIVAKERTWIGGEEVGRVSHMIVGLVVVVLALGAGLAARGKIRDTERSLVPEARLTASTFLELVVEATLSLMEGLMGPEAARRYFPLIGSLAVFILFSNLLGMIPGLVPPTDTLNTTLALGLVVFFATHYFGIKEHGLSYFKHFLGPITKWYALPLMLLMFAIEMISHLVRPCSLAVRLMGNIMGDHKVLFIFLGFGILLVPLPIMALGLVVAVVQTLVFCLLSTVYIALAIEHSEGH